MDNIYIIAGWDTNIKTQFLTQVQVIYLSQTDPTFAHHHTVVRVREHHVLSILVQGRIPEVCV